MLHDRSWLRNGFLRGKQKINVMALLRISTFCWPILLNDKPYLVTLAIEKASGCVA